MLRHLHFCACAIRPPLTNSKNATNPKVFFIESSPETS